jgi:hypothetical protein
MPRHEAIEALDIYKRAGQQVMLSIDFVDVSLWLNILYQHLKCSLVYLLCCSIHYKIKVSTTKNIFARHGVLLKKIVYSCRLVTFLISMTFAKD